MKLTRVVFAMAIQDPSATGLFERKDFSRSNSKSTIERNDDGSITLTAPNGAQVIVCDVPYWCNPEQDPLTLVTPVLPPVTQGQAHPRDRFYKGGRGPRAEK